MRSLLWGIASFAACFAVHWCALSGNLAADSGFYLFPVILAPVVAHRWQRSRSASRLFGELTAVFIGVAASLIACIFVPMPHADAFSRAMYISPMIVWPFAGAILCALLVIAARVREDQANR